MTSDAPVGDLDVAIIGISCRFPGAASQSQFWQNLATGVESIRPLSDADLVSAGVPGDHISDPSYVRAAAVLADADLFDAAFFGYSPKEAELLDPQMRLFLE